MHWAVRHVASGQAFFTGATLFVAAAVVSLFLPRIANRLALWTLLLGGTAVAVSSTPIPYWYYAVVAVASVGWAVATCVGKAQRGAVIAVVVLWLIAVVLEAPYHVVPRLQPASSRTLTVLGDSVTAGMGADDKSEKWPAILAKQHDLTVQDLSHMGETVGSARKRLACCRITGAVVIVEIGGNDLLGGTPVRQFAHDLDALLERVCSPERQVMMFELPLPPFSHEYGRVQRQLARKYGVALIPKRIFLSVLASDGATLDTIHLSQSGHQLMAECVWGLLRPAFSQQPEEPYAADQTRLSQAADVVR